MNECVTCTGIIIAVHPELETTVFTRCVFCVTITCGLDDLLPASMGGLGKGFLGATTEAA